mmetsp:Transcript_72489/g.169836  ORF Transcript_72489/g.169836 Transcript_72489/m.169836 type:complete len:410 (-) Transcript_72489:49-1278(-)
MDKDIKLIADVLGNDVEAQLHAMKLNESIVTVLAQLALQTVRMGIDYKTLGVGWHHPSTRMAYRSCKHRSTCAPASRKRASASRVRLLDAIASFGNGRADPQSVLTKIFLLEIGCHSVSGVAASWDGVKAALEAELLLPLRALNECRMTQTMCGAPLPADDLSDVVQQITQAVLQKIGGFSEWRYTCLRGQEQLRGLSEAQMGMWREATTMEHAALRTHEDCAGELGFFWATKIGGPSHGFDYETQCILPLLANARHKVILLSDAGWAHHPVGRAHWRMLWSVGSSGKKPPEPRLWLEAVNADFEAPVATEGWEVAVLTHAVTKANMMNVPLSVEVGLASVVQHVIGSKDVEEVTERILLRRSNAIVEASDYLSSEHDWVQDEDEITMPIARLLYTPRRKRLLEQTAEA